MKNLLLGARLSHIYICPEMRAKVLDQRAVALVVQTRCADVKPLWESPAESLTLFSDDWFNLTVCVDLFTTLTYMLYSINVCRNFPINSKVARMSKTHKFRTWLNITLLYRDLWNKIQLLFYNNFLQLLQLFVLKCHSFSMFFMTVQIL